MRLHKVFRAACATLCVSFAASIVAARAAASPVVTVRAATTSVAVFAPAEFVVSVSGGSAPYKNPFDPDEVAIDAVFTGPHGRTLPRIPGFWYAPYRRGAADAKTGGIAMTAVVGEAAGWRVRIAPPAAGIWHVRVTARDRSGSATSAPLAFTVAPSSDHGFVRRATGAGRKRYFQFDDGSPFFLVGENVGWAGRRGLADYDDWFSALSRAGANYARVWMAFAPLESKESGLGRYDLQNAAYFDQVLELARRQHLDCMLAFDTYGDLASGGYFQEGAWNKNPYNTANGGPVPSATPDAFFTNPAARKIYKNRLRYIIARYSAYTSVGLWEFWNEKDGPGAWFSEMADYVRTIDPHAHLITNSFTTVGTADVWSLPTFDLTQTHRYGDNGSLRDIAPGLPGDTRAHDVYDKPHLLGEFGIAWQDSDIKYDPRGVGTNLHNGLWGSAFSGNAGGGAIWWWDSYIAPKNLYGEFTSLSRFARTVDWPRRAFEPITLAAPSKRQTDPETFSDIVLTPATGWGAKSDGPITVERSGRTAGPGTVIGMLYGPDKAEMRSVLTFDVDLPGPSALTFHVMTVSQRSNIRVSVDGKTAAEFPLDASPAALGTPPSPARDHESTVKHPEYGGIYQAVFNKDRMVPLTAGKHRVSLENTAGDWMSISSYRFSTARSSRFSPLLPYALQDRATGETLVWLEDPDSNWQNDRDGKTPQLQTGVSLRVPFAHAGRYQATWWDTRKGVVIGRVPLQASGKGGGAVTLSVPPFTRDIAVRIAGYGMKPGAAR